MATSDDIDFTKFPQLATELRLKIWLHALPGPKVFEIEWCDKLSLWFSSKESRNAVCGLVRANSESREVYLKHYKPLLVQSTSSKGQTSCCHNSSGPTAYMDPMIDILYLGANSENEYCFCPQALTALKSIPIISKVQILACELKECIDGAEEYESQPWASFSFPGTFILAWGDIDYENFERQKERPAGEIKLLELSTEEEACDKVRELKEWYKDEAAKLTARVPEMKLMRLSRGGKAMEQLGI